MGEKIRHEFDDCVRRGKTKKFPGAKAMRENADYEENFSESGAHKLVNIAREFLDEARKVLDHAH